MSPKGYDEDDLVEQPAIKLFAALGWQTVNAYDETFTPTGGVPLGREAKRDVLLLARLRPALQRLNPHLPPQAIDLVIEELARDRSALSAANANREVYELLKDGVRISVTVDGHEEPLLARVIDWEHPNQNDLLLVSQLWVTGDVYTRRADLVGFVNGIPLVFVELKAAHKRLKSAYDDNLRDYRTAIPHLFWYNACVILSNGSESRIGSITSQWEHFAEWKKIDSEGEQGIVSLETMIRGVCQPARLLDLVENFTLFSAIPGGVAKVLAKNHQLLGVNNAVRQLGDIRPHQGRLGVLWHTQRSGKRFSMLFFAQKLLRKVPGHHTFVILTDRKELDEQIYGSFAAAGAVTEAEDTVRAGSGDHLRTLLAEDHRYVFTLIQKFHTAPGATYPVISTRSHIIVIADEAHRSQYDTYAENMRNALPNAAFIAFTGTPLMMSEEKTRDVFGDYVSVYNFQQSVQDGATVPLYYENRIPEVQLTNLQLNEDMEAILDAAELDDDQQRKLEREFAREYHIITGEQRLETIAQDVVAHFTERGFRGKAMFVAIDKAMAVSMHDRVRRHWSARIAALEGEAAATTDAAEVAALRDTIDYMRSTDMAVVVSQSQNEAADLAKRGLDILPHRKRMLNEDLARKFKDPDDAFRLVFVCAMWMTGFDVPSCSTIYLDKPMRNHTLMQTIARANRVFPEKQNGLIVDYIGVFRSLQQALAIYGAGGMATAGGGETPVQDKAALVSQLALAIADATAFLVDHGVSAGAIIAAGGFDRVRLVDDAVEAVLVNDEAKAHYLALAAQVDRLYRAVQPDVAINEHRPLRTVIWIIADKIRSLIPRADITEVMEEVAGLLDRSIDTRGYAIGGTTELEVREGPVEYNPNRVFDLSNIDFEALKAAFDTGRKHTEAEKLKAALSVQLKRMVDLNKQRLDYLERFQELIDEYNSGSSNIQGFFDQLLKFAQDLSVEDQRHIAEQLTEEELAVFDLLTKPDPTLTTAEEAEVKKVARTLLDTLKREKLVLDWRKRQQSRAAVWVTIEELLDQLPPAYDPEVYGRKCTALYQHVYDAYAGAGQSVYA